MSDQQREESTEVEATGKLKDGRATIEAKLGTATLSASWDVKNGDDDVDVLLNSAPQIAIGVWAAILEAQEADRG